MDGRAGAAAKVATTQGLSDTKRAGAAANVATAQGLSDIKKEEVKRLIKEERSENVTTSNVIEKTIIKNEIPAHILKEIDLKNEMILKY